MFKLSQEDRLFVDSIWDKLDAKLSGASVLSRDKLPYSTKDGIHDDLGKDPIYRWTNGFWPGLMWLMYVGTGKGDYRITAENAENMLDAALAMPECLCHDVGFMWHISSGINYRLFGGENSRARTLTAANLLAGRYNCMGKFIRAWNWSSAPKGCLHRLHRYSPSRSM